MAGFPRLVQKCLGGEGSPNQSSGRIGGGGGGRKTRGGIERLIDGGGNGESPKSGGREVFVGGGVRHDFICVYGSVLVRGKAGGSKVLVRGWGLHVIALYYSCMGQGGFGG